jgi:16S rRNA (uracil1498-N3)-methyltransferase
VGDEIVLFDGGGAEFAARISRIQRASVDLTILGRVEVDRELPFQLSLAVALPKGDRQRWLVEKAVELGVRRLVPLTTDRGVAQPVQRARERLTRTVIEASKQCGRNRLMQIAAPATLQQFFAEASADTVRLIAHPSETAESVSPSLTGSGVTPVMLAVGPEGGFTEEEIAAVTGKCRLVSLGARILRVETAALALAAAIVSFRSLGA